MSDESIEKMLDSEYNIKLTGSMMGYILSLLADQQRLLNEQMADNITDAMSAMAAAANDVVGNHFLHEAYRVAGARFLAFSMGGSEEELKTIMTSTDKDEIRKAARKVMKVQKKDLN